MRNTVTSNITMTEPKKIIDNDDNKSSSRMRNTI